MTKIDGKAIGQAWIKPFPQWVKNCALIPVKTKVSTPDISDAMSSDIKKANSKALYFFGIFIVYMISKASFLGIEQYSFRC